MHEDKPKDTYSAGNKTKSESKESVVRTNEPQTDNPQIEPRSGTCNAGSGSELISSMVVPVWISTQNNPNSEQLVYALLDTQSDTTFVLRQVAERLQSENQEATRLRLTTLTSTSKLINCQKYKDLVVRGYNQDIRIALPTTYSRDQIPLDESHIPTRDVAERWSHLRVIAPKIQPLLNCDIRLLVGYNCPQALAPRHCITGIGNEPFAVCTDLGWSVVGYVSLSDDSGDAIGLTNLTVRQRVCDEVKIV